ncbi:sugar ABC transporter permease [Paenibacillus psychroresistens]|uniref:Sugar ABC transporter permease n=1 Tax=Paenibacillus psychroresistens TaxID=1778678 RepID=A0A6B8RWZ0_9BACL|nr:ABC transporter permease subunit [Paenibacillus psychroresistens]QGR00393.1 sugar ABC transporter permease [Paenibacillus psychroresistens]
MILPTLLLFAVMSYLPMVGIYLAFTQFNFRQGFFGSPFVGFDNFKFLFKSGTLFNITRNTILYNLVFIFLSNFLGMLIAIMLNEVRSRWFKRITQSVMFFPYFISFVIVGAFVYNIFNYESGFLNSLLKSVHLEAFNAYGTTWIWKYLLVALYLWKNIGYTTIIYLAAITGINEEYYEAARIDGANIFQQIRRITIPLLFPTFIVLLLLSLGGIMRGQFDLFYQVIGSNGTLFNSTDIIDTYVFRSLKVTFDIGLGTAAGLYQSFFGCILVLTVNYLIRRKHEEYALF